MTYIWNIWKPREAYNAMLEKEKQLGSDEAAHAKPVYRSENDTHSMVQSRGGPSGARATSSTHTTRNVYSL